MPDEQQVDPHAGINEAIRQRVSGGSSLADRREQLARRLGFISAEPPDPNELGDDTPDAAA